MDIWTVTGWVIIPSLYLLYKHWPFGPKPPAHWKRRKIREIRPRMENWREATPEEVRAATALSRKKAYYLAQHREWDAQFNDLAFQEMIVWNGVLMTKEQADFEYYKEQQSRLRRNET